MNCKACKKQIDDDSLYCKWCGERQIRERKKKGEISVPAPKQLPSGTWFGRIMVKGERVSVSAPTEKEYYAQARGIKSGLIEIAKTAPAMTLKQACEADIKKRGPALSPSTVRGYTDITRTRFQSYMEQDINKIDYQQMINDELKAVSAKTVKNAWGFVKGALKAAKFNVPDVTLAQVPEKELPWLEPEQIPVFLKAIEGKPGELGALFALHGLRKSELFALTPSKINNGIIDVHGAVVTGTDGRVTKETNKNAGSQRMVKIRIPRLQQLINESPNGPDEPYMICNPSTLYTQINNACDSAGLPRVGVHGLRRSFASLAQSLGWTEASTMEEGGWSDRTTMHKKYVKQSRADRLKQSDSMDEFYKKL